ncbi:hypothetical protein Btru_001766 [Bulinus truncatus]|nr:hypothetical protein Btru_001766 [Bulinus truncatus]
MVLHNDNAPRVMEVKLCQLSLYRHDKSSLLLKTRNNPPMGDKIDTQRLPLVEPQPFTKRCWRREKSLPFFYEKHDHLAYASQPFGVSNLAIKTSSLLKELEVERPQMSPTADGSAVKKTTAHPKAEFSYSRVQAWRGHDLIPSFYSRSERTKTSLRKINTEEERQDFVSTSAIETQQQRANKMRVMGGRLHHRIQKRHLLYLNPLDNYRYSDVRPPATSFSEPGSLKMRHEETRDCSSPGLHDTDLVESPQKFHWKLGFARNALDIMKKCGAPTRLERNLRKELTMNLERLRRDHTLLHSYLASPAQHYSLNDKNCTPGERHLTYAREANTSRKLKNKQEPIQMNSSPVIRVPGTMDVNCRLESSLVAVSKCPTERGKPNESKMKHPMNAQVDNEMKRSANDTQEGGHTAVIVRSASADTKSQSPDIESEENFPDSGVTLTENELNENVPTVNEEQNENPSNGPISSKAVIESLHNDATLLIKGRSRSADTLSRKKGSHEMTERPNQKIPDFSNRDVDGSGSQSNPGILAQRTKTTTEYLDTIMGKVELPGQKLQERPTSGVSSGGAPAHWWPIEPLIGAPKHWRPIGLLIGALKHWWPIGLLIGALKHWWPIGLLIGAPKHWSPKTLVANRAINRSPKTPVANRAIHRSPKTPVANRAINRSPKTPVANRAIHRSPKTPVADWAIHRSPKIPVANLAIHRSPKTLTPVANRAINRSPKTPVANRAIHRSPKTPVANWAIIRSPKTPVANRAIHRSPKTPVANRAIHRSPKTPVPNRAIHRSPKTPVANWAIHRSPKTLVIIELLIGALSTLVTHWAINRSPKTLVTH